MAIDSNELMFPIMGDPILKAVPFAFLKGHEAQAMANHGGQTLQGLKNRGGLDIIEAESIVLDRPFPMTRTLDAKEFARARANLLRKLWQFECDRAAGPGSR